MNHMHPATANDRGFTMTVVMPLLLVLLAFAAAMLQLTRSGMHFTSLSSARQKAFYVADGGLQTALTRLNMDRETASSNASYGVSGEGTLDGGSFVYAIAQDSMYPSDPSRKLVTATGTIAGSSSTVVSQVKVYPFAAPPGPPLPPDPPLLGSPTCAWAMFANRGVAEVMNASSVVTDLLNGNIHSNNDLQVTTLTGAGVHGSGRFESVNRTVSTALVGSISSTLHAELYRGGSYVMTGALSDAHNPLNGAPLFGIHFANGTMNHGVQQAVAAIPFPVPDWIGLERSLTHVDKDHVPFGSWDESTNTWIVNGVQIFSAENSPRYFVYGNVRFRGIQLARSTEGVIAAKGSIAVDELSLLQTAVGSVLGINLNSQQALRLFARKGVDPARDQGNVYIGRGLQQDATEALADTTLPGLNLSAAVAVTNRIAAYSENGDVWVKAAAITGLADTKLNLIADHDATYAVTGSLLSSPSAYLTPGTYCQPMT